MILLFILVSKCFQFIGEYDNQIILYSANTINSVCYVSLIENERSWNCHKDLHAILNVRRKNCFTDSEKLKNSLKLRGKNGKICV